MSEQVLPIYRTSIYKDNTSEEVCVEVSSVLFNPLFLQYYADEEVALAVWRALIQLQTVLQERKVEEEDDIQGQKLGDIEGVVDEFTRLYSEDDDKFASAIIFQIRDILENSE